MALRTTWGLAKLGQKEVIHLFVLLSSSVRAEGILLGFCSYHQLLLTLLSSGSGQKEF